MGAQATESKRIGVSAQEEKAMAINRNHDVSTARRFYERSSIQTYVDCTCTFKAACCAHRSARVVTEHLQKLRDKRRADSELAGGPGPVQKKVKREAKPVKSEQQSAQWADAEVVD